MKTGKMTEGNPFKIIFFFAVPMILSNLFQQLYSVIDTLIVGNRLGQDALAAVGSAGSITAVFVQLSTGLALGGSIVI
jgi:Na+-driven multidrug efflux pump